MHFRSTCWYACWNTQLCVCACITQLFRQALDPRSLRWYVKLTVCACVQATIEAMYQICQAVLYVCVLYFMAGFDRTAGKWHCALDCIIGSTLAASLLVAADLLQCPWICNVHASLLHIVCSMSRLLHAVVVMLCFGSSLCLCPSNVILAIVTAVFCAAFSLCAATLLP